ncbi:DUF4367 domain-containing protein [Halobacillus naozhouensis]|uniref:DUF4367 domain-containing protein n=1 Tax=Halobacillus naozhouensis TaxID=554880 RepID=A0ABY8J2P4_9BACI|nr:DUF4367 domain-containing protein [Halobacillus naozhouensis]WFT76351.1 DUF4367 domain-containing protein [Halobacillus naozhouensis]
MKKIVYLGLLLFILGGCTDGTSSAELVDYNKAKVIHSLEKLSFNPEIPNALPFKPAEIRVNVEGVGSREGRFFKVSFLSEDRDEITFRALESQNAIDFSDETVQINENLEGSYGEKDNIQILKWEKDDIYYELFVDSDSVSKRKMLKIAGDFYRPK